MEIFKVLENEVHAEIVEKKSRFIAHAYHIESIEEAENKIQSIKKEYHDAKHNCFAYAIETNDGGIAVKYNDDGEPRRNSRFSYFKSFIRNEFIKYFSYCY